MATMWFARDGKRPHSQNGPGRSLTLADVEAIFPNDELRYVGLEAPSINPETPSHSEKNVVLEIEADEPVNSRIPETGFYLVVGVHPHEAKRRLDAHQVQADSPDASNAA